MGSDTLKCLQRFGLWSFCGAFLVSCSQDKSSGRESIAFATLGGKSPEAKALPASSEAPGNFNFCPQKKQLNLSNLVWLSYLSGLEYSHFSESSRKLVDLGFGSKEDEKFYQKLAHQIELSKLEASIPTKLKFWSSEAQRLTLLSDSVARYKESYGEPTFKRDILSLYETYIDTSDPDRKLYYIVGTRPDPERTVAQASTQAFYAHHDAQDLTVISFRGTEVDSQDDIGINIDVALTPMKEFQSENVMRGFYRAYKQVDRKVLELLESQSLRRDTPLNLWITGHSLGGAAATLLTADLLNQKRQGKLKNIHIMGLYTFGSPRVGDNKFAVRFDALAMYLNVPIYRVRNYRDIVAGVPFGLNTNPGFWHVGSLVYIDEKGDVHYGNGWRDIEKNSDLLKSTPTSLADHHIGSYTQKLRAFSLTTADPKIRSCLATSGERGFAPFVENPDLRNIDWKEITKNLKY